MTAADDHRAIMAVAGKGRVMGVLTGLMKKAFTGDGCARSVEKAGRDGLDGSELTEREATGPAVFGLHAVRSRSEARSGCGQGVSETSSAAFA